MKLLFNSTTKRIIDLSAIILFGLTFLSIPLFSFLPSLYVITWVLTILTLGLMVISTVLYKKIVLDETVFIYIIFIFVMLISFVLNGFKSFSFTPFLNVFLIIIIYTYCTSYKPQIKRFLISSQIGIIVFGLFFVILQRQDFLSLDFDRLGSRFGDINDISIILSLGFCISFYFSFYNKRLIFILLNAASSMFLLFLSFSCGSKIAIFLDVTTIVATVILYFGRKRWFVSLIILVVLVLLVIVIINIPLFSTLKDRFLNMVYTLMGKTYKTYNYDGSTLSRVEMIQNALSIFGRRPLFGSGIDGFVTFSCFEGWSHNHFAESLCDYGIVGTIFYHFPIVLFIRFLYKKHTMCDYRPFSIIILIFYFVSMISISLFGEKFFSLMIGFILSLNEKHLYSLSFGIKDSFRSKYGYC